MFRDFKLGSYRFVLGVEEGGAVLPSSKISIFQDQYFKEALHRHACKMSRQVCGDCLLKMECAYAYLFDAVAPGSWGMRRFGPLVPPFTWHPPLEKKTDYMAGEKISFVLNLFGNGLKFLPVFIQTFEQLAQDGFGRKDNSIVLNRVEEAGIFSGSSRVFLERGKGAVLETGEGTTGVQFEDWAAKFQTVSRLSLLFITPVLLPRQGSLPEELNFSFFLRETIKRTQVLYYFFHQMKELEIAYHKMLDSAAEIRMTKNQTRFISQEKSWKGIPGGGFLGEVEFQGKLKEFLPFLKLGEYIHLGGNTAVGFGRYRLKLVHAV